MQEIKKQKQFKFLAPVTRLQIFVLSLFVIFLFSDIGFSESQEVNNKKNTPQSAEVKKNNNSEPNTIIIYYFHGTKRCTSCKKIENWSYNAIQKNFAENLKTGKMVWKPVNTDKPENKHFLSDFQLYTKSLILVEVQGKEQKRWKNLKKVWQLLQNEQSFYEYVKREVYNFKEGI